MGLFSHSDNTLFEIVICSWQLCLLRSPSAENLLDSFIVSLHNPNGRQMPAVRAVQGDCQWPLGNIGSSQRSHEIRIHCNQGNPQRMRRRFSHKRVIPAIETMSHTLMKVLKPLGCDCVAVWKPPFQSVTPQDCTPLCSGRFLWWFNNLANDMLPKYPSLPPTGMVIPGDFPRKIDKVVRVFNLALLSSPQMSKKSSAVRNFVFTITKFTHDEVIKRKHFPRYWRFARGIHQSPADSHHKGQWRRSLMASLIFAWTNAWASNRDAGDLRRRRTSYDVTVMMWTVWALFPLTSHKIGHESDFQLTLYPRIILFWF